MRHARDRNPPEKRSGWTRLGSDAARGCSSCLHDGEKEEKEAAEDKAEHRAATLLLSKEKPFRNVAPVRRRHRLPLLLPRVLWTVFGSPREVPAKSTVRDVLVYDAATSAKRE